MRTTGRFGMRLWHLFGALELLVSLTTQFALGRRKLTPYLSIVAAVSSAIDYKLTFAKTYNSAAESEEATRQCHKRSAQRVLKQLLANGGRSWAHC